MTLIDIGCNLASSRLYRQAAAVIARAEAAGVAEQVITGSDWQSNETCIALAQKYAHIHATAGFHPHNADSWDDVNHPNLLQSIAQDAHVVAVGEMGLDYCRHLASPRMQKRCFEQQLAVAALVKKPVFLHMREAFPDFAAILAPALPQLTGAVLHCFTGTREELAWAISHGLYIGITGWICDPARGASLRDIVRDIPDDRLMIETDAPYLAPKTLNPVPRINEPCYLPEVLKTLAQARGQEAAELAALTTANAQRFFGI